MKTKIQYTAPTVKVVAFKVEDIFQSRGINLIHTPAPDDDYNANSMQNWTDGGGIFGQSNDWND